ncbi:MAG: PTS system mannose/fructose/sorbose family transporter subunit IID [Propionicimonas sp.]|uniref:PTS system mannose/fructose/sorbose family transporter subunit IID n=1 Tax=Propionicimonas sp. TaxID=1955623 RepID=UPI002B208B9E|nr:PTS system mannose/fructose/sorbose family transporter subunit IID [Propionicimonas sp.]MEA4945463.1 PTS system mannose/fructose/sorbose family transporter subunit IID [Propionicimonas sp.]MEA5053037.1 PTS system mannose/fructose/sorbose family transporter subunit IID [Propionicimonas sp.]MEA5117434.1 PTS system mannose/fructose/sorbose family transporter subunit IID [Propionicimonas sp.]
MTTSEQTEIEPIQHEVQPITKKDLRTAFWYSLPFYWVWGMERQGAAGFMYSLFPILKKVYKGQPEKLQESLVRNNELFAIADQFLQFVVGMVASMEEENAKTDDFDTNAIRNVKVAIMGPLAGIGDSFFMGTLRVIGVGVGTSLMLQGNALGMLLYFLIWAVPCFTIKYFGIFLGYNLGANFISRMQSSGLMDTVLEAAGVLGMMAIGAMSVSMVNVNFTLPISAGAEGEQVQTLQGVLDSIMPGIMNVAVVWGCFALLRKRVHPLILIFGIMIICCAFKAFGIV